MKYKYISIFIGLLAGASLVYGGHQFMMADACLDSGGIVERTTGNCISADTYEKFYIVLSWPMFVIYVVIGMLSAFITGFIINKLLSSISDLNEET